MTLEMALIGAAAGLGNALVGFASKWSKNDARSEAFDPLKFGRTVLIGTVVGGVYGYTGMDLSSVLDANSTLWVNIMMTYALTDGAENIFKSFYNSINLLMKVYQQPPPKSEIKTL